MNMNRITTLFCLLFLPSMYAISADRKPLPRPVLKKIKHEPVRTGNRYNLITGEREKYDREGKIVYDDNTGNFFLQWVGIDGQRKTIIYKPATRLDVVVIAKVVSVPDEGSYQYFYILKNLPSSQRKLQNLYLETGARIRDVQAPDASWYSRPFTGYLKGVLKVADGWVWSDTLRGRAGSPPGKTIEGVSFRSSGLPGIVKCYVRHNGRLKGVGEELPEELHAAIDSVAWKIPQGITVGPVAKPESVDPATLVRNIIHLLDVSVEQGWINSQTLAQEIRGKLEKIVLTISQDSSVRARGNIESVLVLIENEGGKGLLSEAYALLRFNLEYVQTLIDEN